MWFVEETSKFLVGQTAQSLTCSIMVKPHNPCIRNLIREGRWKWSRWRWDLDPSQNGIEAQHKAQNKQNLSDEISDIGVTRIYYIAYPNSTFYDAILEGKESEYKVSPPAIVSQSLLKGSQPPPRRGPFPITWPSLFDQDELTSCRLHIGQSRVAWMSHNSAYSLFITYYQLISEKKFLPSSENWANGEN